MVEYQVTVYTAEESKEDVQKNAEKATEPDKDDKKGGKNKKVRILSQNGVECGRIFKQKRIDIF